MSRMNGYTIVWCDNCKHQTTVYTVSVDKYLPAAGWTSRDGKDYCPKCVLPKTDVVRMWCDGSSDGKGPKTRLSDDPVVGGWAYVLAATGRIYKYSAFITGGPATNQLMELHAIGEALSCNQYGDGAIVHIYSDSECAIRWITGEYKCNVSYLREKRDWIRGLVQKRCLEVNYHWVPGHSGNALNERADTLAFAARMLGSYDDAGFIVPGEWVPYEDEHE